MNESQNNTHATEGRNSHSGEPLEATTARDANTRSPQFAAPEHHGEVGRLGRYRVLKELGRGGMGAVYLGYDDSLDRKVALKVMLPEFAANSTARERFLREARSAAKVKSDHVVTIHDVGEANGIPFIAMEYLLGAPLDKYLQKKGELSLEHAIRVTRETAIGLSAVHALGLVHRDIKPGNIWLEAPKGRVKLLDFGLARGASDDVQITGSGAVLGTVAYMSPEQGRGQKIDARSDLFSLGVMLYRLTTGKMPFVGETAMVVLTSLAIDDPIPPRQHNPRIPVAVEAVILKLLAKNPAERFQTAEQVAQALLDATEVSTELPVVVAVPAQPLLIGAQTQNVWENVLDSESVPVPLETPSEATENDSPPVTKPKRAVPERKVSKLPLYVAGAVFVLACAVLAAVLLWPKKPQDEVAQNDDKKNIKQPDKVPNDKKNDPLPKVDADASHIKAVEWILSIGGTAEVTVNGVQREVATRADLPKEPFVLTGVQIRNNEKVTDEGLRNLKDCHTIRAINLTYTPITNAGLAHLQGLKNLELLWAASTVISDDGLAHFQSAKQLTELNLAETKVTDAGLAYFKNCPKLNTLIVYSTGLTDKGFATFKGSDTLVYLQLGNTRITNEGLANFRDNKNLIFLHLTDTKISDAGISYFKDCTTLKGLVLFNTDVTDAVIPHLREFKNLAELNVQKTKITANGLVELQKLLPNCRIEHDGGVIEPANPAIAERKVAEYILHAGGKVRVRTKGNISREYSFVEDLPKEPFDVTSIDLSGNKFTAEGLAVCRECRNITSLSLNGENITDECLAHFANCGPLTELTIRSPKITDAGLAHFAKQLSLSRLHFALSKNITDAGISHFKDCKQLSDVSFSVTQITNAGLAHMQKWDKLGSLFLVDTAITDDGLVHLAHMTKLGTVSLRGTKVTEVGAITLANQLGCVVDWNGGSIKGSPKPKAGADDRETAKYILGVGGRVRAKTATETVPVFKLEELPAGPLAVTYLELINKDLSDEGWQKLAALRSLTEVIVQGPTFTDAIAAQFSSLNIEEIRVTNTKVGDRGLATLTAGKKMRRADVSRTDVGDTGLKSLAACPDLIDLNLSKTTISNAGLAHLKDAKKLIWLHLNDTAITDDGLKHLEGLQALRQLTLKNTQITEPALKALKLKLHPDCEIEWDKGKVKP